MGLFRDKGMCSICGESAGKEISDGYLCKKCQTKAGMFLISKQLNTKSWTVTAVNECIEKNKIFLNNQEERRDAFNITRKIGGFVYLDENNTLFKINGNNDIFRYDQILDYELLEDGESITKGGLGRAAVGGILFGGVGAIVGGVTGGKKAKVICTSLKIRISLKNYFNENIYINLISTNSKTSGIIYKTCKSTSNDILSLLDKITASHESLNSPNTSYDELKKVKELLDMGIITQEEFELKKKQLLEI